MEKVWLTLCIIYNIAKIAVGSSRFALQTCGNNTAYYCPTDFICRTNRNNRCSSKDTCEYIDDDDKCWRHPDDPEAYLVQLGRVKVRDYIPKSKLVSHHYINYKGFTYEFGSYRAQILDINDFLYKYRRTCHDCLKPVGYSYCSYEDANLFAHMWTMRKYHLVANNCQHFAKALTKFLTTGICSRKRSLRSRKYLLKYWADNILLDCRIVCCHGIWSSSISVLFLSFTTMLSMYTY